MDVEIDVGFDFKTKQRLRLLGINTPERNQVGYLEAKQFLVDMCLGKSVQITTHEKDAFGRWLSMVYVEGENLNDMILKNGLAVEYKH